MFHREEFNRTRDEHSHPPIPDATLFWTGFEWKEGTIIGWDWSTTFGKWGAFIDFGDGKGTIFTFPKHTEG